MAATTKLIVYNLTLQELRSHPLADLVAVNSRLTELNNAYDHAVEYVLAKMDWNFARRRSTLTGTADTSFSPFTQRFSKPADYLRKVWIKTAANDDAQISHAEVAANIYAFQASALLEYMSDHADNYNPANWPPQFTRCLVLYLAALTAPKLAGAGSDEDVNWYQKLDIALADAERLEAVYTINAEIATERHPVLRRAIEMMGQSLAGTSAINSRVDEIRWSMNKAWDSSVKYVLTQGAWNFASKHAVFRSAEAGDTNIPTESIVGITEGYSVPPAEPDDPLDISGWDYSYELPSDFLHKLWIKASVHHDVECPHATVGRYMFCNYDPAIMQYVAANEDTMDPDNWPLLFSEAVSAYLALIAAPELVIEEGGRGKSRVANPNMRGRLEDNFQMKLADAKIKEAIQQYPHRLPLGRFARARFGAGTYGLRRLH